MASYRASLDGAFATTDTNCPMARKDTNRLQPGQTPVGRRARIRHYSRACCRVLDTHARIFPSQAHEKTGLCEAARRGPGSLQTFVRRMPGMLFRTVDTGRDDTGMGIMKTWAFFRDLTSISRASIEACFLARRLMCVCTCRSMTEHGIQV